MAASTRSPSQLSATSSAVRTLAKHYNVFVSFRGPDSRNDLADCLIDKLKSESISHVFLDEKEICGGEQIKNVLIQAIERSEISVPIVSPRYAESKACLLELAHMSLCRKTKSQKVIPIFYDTEPNILERFPQALEEKLGHSSELAEIFNNFEEQIADWKESLSRLAELREKYYSLKKVIIRTPSPDGQTMHDSEPIWSQRWSELFSEVVKDVKSHLRWDDLKLPEELVKSEHHVKEMMRKLGVVYRNGEAVELLRGEEVRVVAITGLGGIGKTTLAKVVYNKIHHLFHTCRFLEEIHNRLQPPEQSHQSSRRDIISELNNQQLLRPNPNSAINDITSMFRSTKALVLLDNVHDGRDIGGFAVKCSWFGPGSRIILTLKTALQKADLTTEAQQHVADDVIEPRDSDLIEKAQEHEVEEMDDKIAVKLFLKHACKWNLPDQKHVDLANQIINVIKGVPSAIVDEGRPLPRNKKIWKEKLRALRENPHAPYVESFKASYELLYDNHSHDKIQQIFLDIACLFAGTDQKVSEYMWNACGWPASTAIDRLCNMFWLKINENNVLWMRDQLKAFGKKTVNGEGECCWMRSRLWNHEAKSTLELNQGNERVRALALGLCCKDPAFSLTSANFARLPNLVFLNLDEALIKGKFNKPLSRLIQLHWQGCSKSEGLRFVNLEELVILDLSGSQVDHTWNGWTEIKKAGNLKVLKLTGCDNLVEFPDLGDKMNLEMLILDRCQRLLKMDSISRLKKLKSLSLKSCGLVGSLPNLSQMSKLKELLVDATDITDFSRVTTSSRQVSFLDSLKKIKILSACVCKKLESLPDSIEKLERLEKLALDDAILIQKLPSSITSLTKLKYLSMRGCTKITSLPQGIGNMNSLETLELSGTKIDVLPLSVGNLKNLKVLKMRNTHLRSFPNQVTSLVKLEVMDLRNCTILVGEIPTDINKLSSLRVLGLSYTKISKLPMESITELFHLQHLEICEVPGLQNCSIPPILKEIVKQCQRDEQKPRQLPECSRVDHEEFKLFENGCSQFF